jgi:hypothetical protein
MTQADRVLSTPPTNTPIDTMRRRFLSVAAGGAVAATIALPAFATAPADDPVFDLIEAHRRAHVAHMDALTLQDRLERAHDPDAGRVSEKPCHDEDEAFEAFGCSRDHAAGSDRVAGLPSGTGERVRDGMDDV